MTSSTNVSHLSSKDLEKLWKETKRRERLEKEKKKKQYEELRDSLVAYMVTNAIDLHTQLKEFKKECHNKFEAFRQHALEYGEIRSDSKGGYSLRTADNKMLARLERNVVHEYDERADLALGLLREFLEEKVKKKSLAAYQTIITLIEKNKSGDLKPELMAKLAKIRNSWQDEKWHKALDLLEESYREREVSYNVSFFLKDELGKDQPVVLTFSSL